MCPRQAVAPVVNAAGKSTQLTSGHWHSEPCKYHARVIWAIGKQKQGHCRHLSATTMLNYAHFKFWNFRAGRSGFSAETTRSIYTLEVNSNLLVKILSQWLVYKFPYVSFFWDWLETIALSSCTLERNRLVLCLAPVQNQAFPLNKGLLYTFCPQVLRD